MGILTSRSDEKLPQNPSILIRSRASGGVSRSHFTHVVGSSSSLVTGKHTKTWGNVACWIWITPSTLKSAEVGTVVVGDAFRNISVGSGDLAAERGCCMGARVMLFDCPLSQ